MRSLEAPDLVTILPDSEPKRKQAAAGGVEQVQPLRRVDTEQVQHPYRAKTEQGASRPRVNTERAGGKYH